MSTFPVYEYRGQPVRSNYSVFSYDYQTEANSLTQQIFQKQQKLPD